MRFWPRKTCSALAFDGDRALFLRAAVNRERRRVDLVDCQYIALPVASSETEEEWGRKLAAALPAGATVALSWPLGATRFCEPERAQHGGLAPNRHTSPVELGGRPFWLEARVDEAKVVSTARALESRAELTAVEPAELAMVRPFAELGAARGALFALTDGPMIFFAQIWHDEPIFFRVVQLSGEPALDRLTTETTRTVDYLNDRWPETTRSLRFVLGPERVEAAKILATAGIEARPISPADCWDGDLETLESPVALAALGLLLGASS